MKEGDWSTSFQNYLETELIGDCTSWKGVGKMESAKNVCFLQSGGL